MLLDFNNSSSQQTNRCNGLQVSQNSSIHQQHLSKQNPPPAMSSAYHSAGDDCAINELLEGRMDLDVLMPDGRQVRLTVERRTPMMDLLVQAASATKISPGGHVIHVFGDNGGDKGQALQYKPSTPIGSLDTKTICIVPKKENSDPLARKFGANKTANRPFEPTFRVQVHLPRNQLTVLRVSPRIKIADLKIMVCKEKGLDTSRYQLVRPSGPTQPLSGDMTLAEYGSTEITLLSNSSIESHICNSTSHIIPYSKRTEESKRRTGILRLLTEDAINKVNETTNYNSAFTVDGAEKTHKQPEEMPLHPSNNRCKPKKRRPAPPPPPSEAPFHSRQSSSDSSGYHEATSSFLHSSEEHSAEEKASSDSSGVSSLVESKIPETPATASKEEQQQQPTKQLPVATCPVPNSRKKKAPLPPPPKLLKEKPVHRQAPPCPSTKSVYVASNVAEKPVSKADSTELAKADLSVETGLSVDGKSNISSSRDSLNVPSEQTDVQVGKNRTTVPKHRKEDTTEETGATFNETGVLSSEDDTTEVHADLPLGQDITAVPGRDTDDSVLPPETRFTDNDGTGSSEDGTKVPENNIITVVPTKEPEPTGTAVPINPTLVVPSRPHHVRELDSSKSRKAPSPPLLLQSEFTISAYTAPAQGIGCVSDNPIIRAISEDTKPLLTEGEDYATSNKDRVTSCEVIRNDPVSEEQQNNNCVASATEKKLDLWEREGHGFDQPGRLTVAEKDLPAVESATDPIKKQEIACRTAPLENNEDIKPSSALPKSYLLSWTSEEEKLKKSSREDLLTYKGGETLSTRVALVALNARIEQDVTQQEIASSIQAAFQSVDCTSPSPQQPSLLAIKQRNQRSGEDTSSNKGRADPQTISAATTTVRVCCSENETRRLPVVSSSGKSQKESPLLKRSNGSREDLHGETRSSPKVVCSPWKSANDSDPKIPSTTLRVRSEDGGSSRKAFKHQHQQKELSSLVLSKRLSESQEALVIEDEDPLPQEDKKIVCAPFSKNLKRSSSLLNFSDSPRNASSPSLLVQSPPRWRSKRQQHQLQRSLSDLSCEDREEDFEAEQQRLQREYIKLQRQFVTWQQQLMSNHAMLRDECIVPQYARTLRQSHSLPEGEDTFEDTKSSVPPLISRSLSYEPTKDRCSTLPRSAINITSLEFGSIPLLTTTNGTSTLRSSKTKSYFKPPQVRASTKNRQRLPPEIKREGVDVDISDDAKMLTTILPSFESLKLITENQDDCEDLGGVSRLRGKVPVVHMSSIFSKSRLNNNGETGNKMADVKHNSNGVSAASITTTSSNGQSQVQTNGFEQSQILKSRTTPVAPPPPPPPAPPSENGVSSKCRNGSVSRRKEVLADKRVDYCSVDPREQLMLEIRKSGGRTALRKISLAS